jgi:uncharacterized membrane protein YgdD (TMEM256/DUF423 family)
MGIAVFVISSVIALFVFHRTASVMWSTIVMFSGVTLMSGSLILTAFFFLSVLMCYIIDKKVSPIN